MRLAIMQPYFLPYLGYWQLVAAADKFVIYDDVNYIKGGWINRNRILSQGEPAYITVPLQQASPNRRICDITLQADAHWRQKMLRTLEHTYRNAPCFDEVFPVLSDLILHPGPGLAEYLAYQLQTLAAWMGLPTRFAIASRDHPKLDAGGQQRVIDICRAEGADQYINAQGGAELYDGQAFAAAGVSLNFLVMRPEPYPQRRSGTFVPYLSIADALMGVGRSDIGRLLGAYDLKPAAPQEAGACPAT